MLSKGLTSSGERALDQGDVKRGHNNTAQMIFFIPHNCYMLNT